MRTPRLCELEALDEFFGRGGDAGARLGGEFAAVGGMGVAENDPETGAIGFVVAGADSAGELSEFEAGAAEEFGENAAGVVDEVAEALGDEDGIYVAGRGLLELVKVVIGEGIFERDLDGGGGLIGVRRNVDGHGDSFTLRALFRIGAAGEDGEGAVELFGEHDAGEFVGEGHGAE
jgi:hypothetical protein